MKFKKCRNRSTQSKVVLNEDEIEKRVKELKLELIDLKLSKVISITKNLFTNDIVVVFSYLGRVLPISQP